MEKVVLKATEMSLATCWVGYFDAEYFNADIKSKRVMRSRVSSSSGIRQRAFAPGQGRQVLG